MAVLLLEGKSELTGDTESEGSMGRLKGVKTGPHGQGVKRVRFGFTLSLEAHAAMQEMQKAGHVQVVSFWLDNLVLQEHKSWKTIKAVEEITFSEPKTTEDTSGNTTE